MKKILGIFVALVLAAAAWAGATHYIGDEVEKQYFAFLEQYSQQQPYFVFENKSYRKGFRQSTAETLVTMPLFSKFAESKDSDGESPAFSFVMVHTLRHGPFPFGKTADGGTLLKPCLAYVETRLPEDSGQWGALAQLLKNVPEIAKSYSYDIIDFAGVATNRTVIPAAEVVIPEENVKFSWQGLESEGRYSSDLAMIDGTMTIPGFEMQFDDGVMRMTGISGDFDLTKAFDYIYVGDADMAMDSLELRFKTREGEWKQMAVNKLAVAATSNNKGEMVNYQETMRLEGLDVAGELYGPAVLDFELLNLNGPAISRLQKEMQTMQANFLGMNKEEMEAATRRMAPLYMSALFNGSPEYNIRELKVSTPQGDVACRLRLRLENADGSLLQNPALLVNHIEAEADIAAGEQLVQALFNVFLRQAVMKQLTNDPNAPSLTDEQIDTLVAQQSAAQLQNLTSQQLLVWDNDSYRTQAAFRQGVLTVNGRRIPISGPQYSNSGGIRH